MTLSTDATTVFGSRYAQFLDVDEFTFASGYGTWAATNASLLVEKTFRFPEKPWNPESTYNTLRIQPLVAATPPALTEFSLETGAKTIATTYGGDYLVATANIYSRIDVQVALEVTDGTTTVTSIYQDIPSFTWVTIRSEELAIPIGNVPTTGKMTLLFKAAAIDNHIHIAHPVLTNSYGFTQNLFLRESFARLPQYLIETDSEQVLPTQPLARLMDAGLGYADVGFRQAESFRYRDISSGYSESDSSTKSGLVSPDVADKSYLPWLGQFVGAKIQTTTTATTPWQNLPSTWEEIHEDIDPTADVVYTISSITRDGSGEVTATTTTSPSGLSVGDTISVEGTSGLNGQFVLTGVNTGTSTLTWDQDGASSTESIGTVTLVDSTWIEIETFNFTDTNLVTSQRDLIRTARTGHNAGTYQAMEDSITGLLSGTKTVRFVIDPIASPWNILVHTLTSETIGGVSNTESQVILNQLIPTKPLGFTVAHLCVDEM